MNPSKRPDQHQDLVQLLSLECETPTGSHKSCQIIITAQIEESRAEASAHKLELQANFQRASQVFKSSNK